KDRTGPKNSRWAGGSSHDSKGYRQVSILQNRREHRVIIERVIGKPLPSKAVVHHVNRIKDANFKGNLVICQDQAYHKFLHQRQRILEAGGNPSLHKICGICKMVKLRSSEFGTTTCRGKPVLNYACKPCVAVRARELRARRKRMEAA